MWFTGKWMHVKWKVFKSERRVQGQQMRVKGKACRIKEPWLTRDIEVLVWIHG